MVYGNGYFGVTESNYAVVALHLHSCLIGCAGAAGRRWEPGGG